jgi:hypothetical protein
MPMRDPRLSRPSRRTPVAPVLIPIFQLSQRSCKYRLQYTRGRFPGATAKKDDTNVARKTGSLSKTTSWLFHGGVRSGLQM